MAITLIAYGNPPARIAVTKVNATIPEGRFFLDFTRNLEVIRWFGIRNRLIGPAVALLIPIVHEGEKLGGYVVSVSVGDPYFQDLRNLWKARFPSPPFEVSQEADGLKIIADFTTQFPQDS